MENKLLRRLSKQKPHQAGFTLVEMISVIVISGIMAVGVTAFIARTVENLDSSARRNQLASAGRVAIDRIAMELHNALPNSIRATTATGGGDQCIEFVPVRAATTYINPPFSGGGGSTFDVVNFTPTQVGENDGYAVIYPRSANQIYDGDSTGAYSTWPNFPNRRPIQAIASVNGIVASGSAGQSAVTLAKVHRFNRRSPNKRFFVVDQPVSFCVASGKLYRYTDYGFFRTQVSQEESGSCVVTDPARCLPNYAASAAIPPRIKILTTDSIDNTGLTAFTVGNQNLTRNSLVAINLNFASGNDSISLSHEVLTRSVP